MPGKVTVGCKLPNGVILELLNIKDSPRVTIKGTNAAALVGGHGITPNVDADFFEAWMKANKDLPFVKAGFIFAHDKPEKTGDEARDRAKNKTGFEPKDPEKDLPKDLKGNKLLETMDEK